MFFKDIPGHADIKENLRKSVKNGRISHALMFFGPEGSGKLALALAFARYISCNEKGDQDACGTCPSCVKYSKLAHPDLHFVYPAGSSEKKEGSESALEKWRETLIENPFIDEHQWYDILGIENKQGLINTKESGEIIRRLNLKSYEADFKILIMWLPERMHATAANKLLKIIEEPPPDTLFFLVSENVEDVLPTIQSRTQFIKIPKLRDDDIREGLRSRFMDISEQSVDDAVRLGDGNFNRALSSVKSDEVSRFNFDTFVSFMRVCFAHNVTDLMSWVEEMGKLGRERQKLFLTYAIRLFRENLLVNTGHSAITHMSAYENDFSLKFSKFITMENIAKLYEDFNMAHAHISYNGYARIIFLDLGLKMFPLIKK